VKILQEVHPEMQRTLAVPCVIAFSPKVKATGYRHCLFLKGSPVLASLYIERNDRMEDFHMSDQTKPTGGGGRHFTWLSIIGVIVFIIGVAIATIPGTHLRGSGLGTLCIIVGVVIVAYDYVRSKK
jgi:hypothetical protein